MVRLESREPTAEKISSSSFNIGVLGDNELLFALLHVRGAEGDVDVAYDARLDKQGG
jgi:hypothetical protein